MCYFSSFISCNYRVQNCDRNLPVIGCFYERVWCEMPTIDCFHTCNLEPAITMPTFQGFARTCHESCLRLNARKLMQWMMLQLTNLLHSCFLWQCLWLNANWFYNWQWKMPAIQCRTVMKEACNFFCNLEMSAMDALIDTRNCLPFVMGLPCSERGFDKAWDWCLKLLVSIRYIGVAVW